MTHNLAVGTVVAGHMTVDGVAGVTVGGVITSFASTSEHYIVAVRFQNIGGRLVHAEEVEMDTPVVVTTL